MRGINQLWLSIHVFHRRTNVILVVLAFVLFVLCQTTPLNLDRKESYFIEYFRNNTMCINRIKVKR